VPGDIDMCKDEVNGWDEENLLRITGMHVNKILKPQRIAIKGHSYWTYSSGSSRHQLILTVLPQLCVDAGGECDCGAKYEACTSCEERRDTTAESMVYTGRTKYKIEFGRGWRLPLETSID
jgi:hypothetical protein